MPVNRDPKRRRKTPASGQTKGPAHLDGTSKQAPTNFGEETDEDKEKALADAESKNLWDATEVIDMDKW
jgi:hypothetical protein